MFPYYQNIEERLTHYVLLYVSMLVTGKLIGLEKKLCNDGCKEIKVRRIEHSILKRELGKEDFTSVSDTFQAEHGCNICRRVCLLKAGLACHIL